MATIRKRALKWQAQVRRIGHPPLARSFASKADAVCWAREHERSIDRGELRTAGIRTLRDITLGALLNRYESSVTAGKSGASVERYRLRTLRRHLGTMTLDRLTTAAISQYRDARLSGSPASKPVAPASVRRELAVLSHCLETAMREWACPLGTNPLREVAMPVPGRSRDRRLSEEEAQRLESALQATKLSYLAPLVTLAIETGMRRGELLSALWVDVDLTSRTLKLRMTKNGHPRIVPLSPVALATVAALPRRGTTIFDVSGNAVRLAWERLRKKAGLPDLHFHDLRHEAVSRFFELGLSVPEVASISGHRDYRTLARYTHLRPEDIAKRLAALSPGRQMSSGDE